jgi:MoxR-like ATPase
LNKKALALPEAQLDRFMFMIEVDYPSLQEKIEIGRTTSLLRATKVSQSSRSFRSLCSASLRVGHGEIVLTNA